MGMVFGWQTHVSTRGIVHMAAKRTQRKGRKVKVVCAEDITSAGGNIRVVLANSLRVLIEITRGADSIDLLADAWTCKADSPNRIMDGLLS
jgi:hypothetical protein